ncbi:hypothetical protein DPMN_142035 [Dreissena polymorpha]|uniref:Uncharacterized protein n=1 Tax=Dreissena polymorpha TaxID=45954 RepID=A0A9D4JKG4_DREPO|nr:hypothetical protein DPMN_142035 [Dreissena polymorpha]
MARSTGLQVLHTQVVEISRYASENFGKTRKEGKCQQHQNTSRKSEIIRRLRRSVKRGIRADNRNYIKTLSTEAEEAAF